MIDFDYLYKGICGLANSHKAAVFDGMSRLVLSVRDGAEVKLIEIQGGGTHGRDNIHYVGVLQNRPMK